MQTEANPYQARQGEVYLRAIAEVPTGAKPVKRSGAIVLSRGSTTQHSHRIEAKTAKLLTLGTGPTERRFLVLQRAARLDCERHAAITLPSGTYEVTIQRQQQLGRTSNSAD